MPCHLNIVLCMCSPAWGAECTHEQGSQRTKMDKGPRLRSRGTQALSCWCPVPPLCDLLLSAFLTSQSHLHISHSSSPLCSEHTQMIVPTGCLSHATLPPDSCSLHLEHTCYLPLRHPLLAPTASAAFKSHIKHCPGCEGFLHYSSCTLPSLPPFLCTFPLCTDVQYDN